MHAAAGSSSRRLSVFHTASNEAEEQQSAKELKGAEHIEKGPSKRERESDGGREEVEGRSIFTLLFRAISSKLDSTGLLLQIVTTAERLPSVPTVSDTTLPASRCQFPLSSPSVGNRVAFSSFAACFFVALNSGRRTAGEGERE